MSTPPPPQSTRNRHQGVYINRTGLYLFLIYLLFYGSFVGVNAFMPVVMKKELILGLNVAVVWGIGLIVTAVILAVAYLYLDHPDEDGAATSDAKGGQR